MTGRRESPLELRWVASLAFLAEICQTVTTVDGLKSKDNTLNILKYFAYETLECWGKGSAGWSRDGIAILWPVMSLFLSKVRPAWVSQGGLYLTHTQWAQSGPSGSGHLKTNDTQDLNGYHSIPLCLRKWDSQYSTIKAGWRKLIIIRRHWVNDIFWY